MLVDVRILFRAVAIHRGMVSQEDGMEVEPAYILDGLYQRNLGSLQCSYVGIPLIAIRSHSIHISILKPVIHRV